jgi:hypothetical protein
MRQLAARTAKAEDVAAVDYETSKRYRVVTLRLVANLAGFVALLVVGVLGVTYLLSPESLLGVAGPLHVSDRHAYVWRLPDRSWTVTVVPGEWKVGEFLNAESAGSDYFEANPPDDVLVYAWLASQPIPPSMSFDGWRYRQYGVTAAAASCFELQGSYQQVRVAEETGWLGVYFCPSFMGSGKGWETVQVLFQHDGRGYAAYFWPEQEPDMASLEQVLSAVERWLSTFRFTAPTATAPGA